MDVERLIWGYIDGELTPEEDQLLRELIARDEQARQLYETVLSLYVELRRDAEMLTPPEPLLHRVEHAVIERMQQQAAPTPSARRRWRQLSLLLLWLLLCAIPLGREQFVPSGQAPNSDSSLQVRQSVPAAAQPLQKAARTQRPRSPAQAPSLEGAEAVPSEPVQHAAGELLPAPVLAQELLPKAQPLLSASPISLLQLPNASQPQRSSVPMEMLLSGGLAKPVGSFKDGIVLTQGLLYELSRDDYIGVEVGMLLRPSNTASQPQASAIPARGGIQGQQPSFSFPPPEAYGPSWSREQILPSLSSAVPERLLWGAVLYARTLLQTDAMALGARLGAGLSTEMPLLITGVHLRQRIGASGLGIALSADARWLVRQPSVWTTLGAGMWLEL